jgi:ferredoxin
MHAYVALNAELAQVWPEITTKEDAMPDADHWATVTDKRAELKEAA